MMTIFPRPTTPRGAKAVFGVMHLQIDFFPMKSVTYEYCVIWYLYIYTIFHDSPELLMNFYVSRKCSIHTLHNKEIKYANSKIPPPKTFSSDC